MHLHDRACTLASLLYIELKSCPSDRHTGISAVTALIGARLAQNES